MAKRDGSHRQGPWWDPAYKVEDTRRITPEVDVHRKFHHHDHPGFEGLPSSYAEALWDRPEVELVAGAERDVDRLKIFGDRYGIEALYTDRPGNVRKGGAGYRGRLHQHQGPGLPDGQGGRGRSQGHLHREAHGLHPGERPTAW